MRVFFAHIVGDAGLVQCLDLRSKAELDLLLERTRASSKVIPERCVKKLFGDVEWTHSQTRDWPKHIKVVR